MVALARRNGFTFDAILGAGIPATTSRSPRSTGTRSRPSGFCASETLMVAAHSHDLAAAAQHGLATAHIARPREHGPAGGETAPGVPVTYAAADLADLARQLGV